MDDGSEQRERFHDAITDLVIEHGYEGTTVEMVIERAGLSEADFERLYPDKSALFMEVYRRNNERFGAPIFAAFEQGKSWRDSLRAAAYGAARFLRDHPKEVQYNVTVTLGAGDLVQAERDTFLQSIIDLVDRGRQEMDDPDSVGRGAAEGVMGSIFTALVREVGGGDPARDAESYVPELMYIAVRPYLGHEAAKKELTIPPPP